MRGKIKYLTQIARSLRRFAPQKLYRHAHFVTSHTRERYVSFKKYFLQ